MPYQTLDFWIVFARIFKRRILMVRNLYDVMEFASRHI